ncbi:hypothetical protein [Streptomyces sp. NTH33]|uniref:hypothetical protein n=1 Tax=Streptomyces sp. NTH33 TaxID=1735453 RepID=UPI0015E88A1D|nr:hypothetical protein [Streptomyces sp. NTH33]
MVGEFVIGGSVVAAVGMALCLSTLLTALCLSTLLTVLCPATLLTALWSLRAPEP